MPRPKGSKNKKKIQTTGDTKKILEEKQEALKAAEEQEGEVLAKIGELKDQLKAVRKAKKAAAKAVDEWTKKVADCEAIDSAAKKKAQIEDAITQLMASGKTPEEILGMLNT